MTIQQTFERAVQHHQAGRLGEAEALYRQILAVQPNHPDALHHLGLIAHQMGRHDLAVQLISRTIALNPQDAGAYSNLGVTLAEQGKWDDAIGAYRKAIALQPGYPESHNNLGNALRARGELTEAVAAYRRALEVQPDYAEAGHNLGIALRDRGELEEALAVAQRVLRLKPDFAEGHDNLGSTLAALGQIEEAIAAYRRALELEPAYAEVYNNLGNALKDRGQLDEAIAAGRRALELKPAYAEAHNNLGNALKDAGEPGAAVFAYRRSIELEPDRAFVHSNLIFTLHFDPASNPRTIAEEQRRWNQRFCAPLEPFILPHINERRPDRRLRIGYVSPDFCAHVAGRNLLPLFRRHDHRDFEIVCYSGVVRPDGLTAEFRQHAELWRSTLGVTDEALAAVIRQDGVDILVDLAQHSANNRLPVFARQPAPVQVSFAGYPESTGVATIGYRISDRWLESEIGDGRSEIGWKREPELRTPNSDLRAERVFLIDSFWCYDSCGMDVDVHAASARESGSLTFGSLNHFSKINEPLLRLWARVLRAAADSRLVMLSGVGEHRQRTRDFLEREGIEARRVEFVGRCPRREYLELYRGLDIVLDTFPYNGHTTSLDALWMGASVVSLAGETRVSRGGLSVLSNLGLPELAAHSQDEYVEIATRLARDLPRLAELRRTLRVRMEASVLMDAPRFARNIEAAYRAIWRRWCAETPR